MPAFDYYVGNGAASFNDSSGSGLAWFGPGGFGDSIVVGTYNDKTYISDGAGITQGAEAYNIKWTHPASGLIGQTGSGLILTSIPNYQATLNLRFTHTSAVKTSNVKFRAYDRTNLNHSPSGVTIWGAEIIHPTLTQVNNGSGSATWVRLDGSGSYLTLTSSPGTSGFRPNGENTSDTRHDHYITITVTPNSIGSKSQIGFECDLDYL